MQEIAWLALEAFGGLGQGIVGFIGKHGFLNEYAFGSRIGFAMAAANFAVPDPYFTRS